MSLLVDTRTGISLLSTCRGKSRDRVKSIEGVTGNDINPCTLIDSLEFEHNSRVVEQVTADAILGLDFFETNNCVW